jgi:hypothetical protein
VVVPDPVAGSLLEPARVGFHRTAGHGFNSAARLAYEVIVMLAGGLVAGPAVGELDLARFTFTLQPPSGPEDRREVCIETASANQRGELFERSGVTVGVGEDREEGVLNGAWARHATRLSYATYLRKPLAFN